ncbi:MAG: glycine oxidase ThiO [Alphaproteobacteria bacterium]|nr:glycine oxidase ThiO [Alphaproteobacteria bacterium]
MKIIIIGAGVAGLAIAWRMARNGTEVLVLDRAQPARGATYASAGMIAVTAETAGAATSEAEFALRSRALWPEFAKELEAISGINISFREDGALIVPASSTEAERLQRQARGGGAEYLTRKETLARAPMLAPDIEGALWAPRDAQVDNRALGPALTNAAIRAGAKLSANEAAVRVEQGASGELVVLSAFRIHRADAVVLAAGAWSGQIGGLAENLPIRPVKGEMLALAPPAPNALPVPLLWGHGIYLVPRNDQLFVGATVEEAGFDTGLSNGARRWLLERAQALVPCLRDWPIREHWAGLRPGTADGLPIIGETGTPGLFLAGGQYRNGILFAPALAEAVERLINKQKVADEIAAFSPGRFDRPV